MNPPETPAPSTPLPDDDSRIDQMLRESSPLYIDDAGFTARIMDALPRPRYRVERRRNILVLVAALLGCGLVAVFGGANSIGFLGTVLVRLAEWSLLPVPGLGTAFTIGVVACWVLTLIAGWWAWVRLR